jgi:uncharacterized protein
MKNLRIWSLLCLIWMGVLAASAQDTGKEKISLGDAMPAITLSSEIYGKVTPADLKDLFDWEKVCREVQVVTPEFYTLKNGKPSTVVIYAKMCRGEMTRFILKNRITHPEQLKEFEWEGFSYHGEEDGKMHFILQ